MVLLCLLWFFAGFMAGLEFSTVSAEAAGGNYSRNLTWAAKQSERVLPSGCPVVHHIIADLRPAETLAWTQYDPATGDGFPCTVFIDRDYLPDFRQSKTLLCIVLAHEHGHLRGIDHENRYDNLMHEDLTHWGGEPGACRSRDGLVLVS